MNKNRPKFFRRRERKRYLWWTFLVFSFYFFVLPNLIENSEESKLPSENEEILSSKSHLRKLQQILPNISDLIGKTSTTKSTTTSTTTTTTTTKPSTTRRTSTISTTTSNNNDDDNCTVPAIERFPRPLIPFEDRKRGALIIHFLTTMYLFVALAIVCDDFFVPSLEMICERLNLSEDVAGATFMAAGSSAPELATAVIGVFVAKDDIGISGVIGSAVFNVLFVIAVCGLFAGQVLTLNWYPMVRDSFCYCMSICGLLIVIANDKIGWLDSTFLLLLYGVYLLILKNNVFLENWFKTCNVPFKNGTKDERSSLFGAKINPSNLTKSLSSPTKDTSNPLNQLAFEGADGAQNQEGYSVINSSQERKTQSINMAEFSEGQVTRHEKLEVEVDAHSKGFIRNTEETDHNPWEVPIGLCERIIWITTLPIVFLHWIFIPDVRTIRWRPWYVLTFLMSMVWIAVYSYIMVWMITIMGFTLGIPDTVMGLTFISVGVSVPDAISSLCVAKQGFGDMAVSNAIGSNVFDILICLGVPWFIQTVIVDPGSTVYIVSKGLTYSTVSLFLTVAFVLGVTHWNNWKLDFKYGLILLVWYFIFMVLSSLYEMNVFGNNYVTVCDTDY